MSPEERAELVAIIVEALTLWHTSQQSGSNALRQRRYRERHRNVTRNVTSNASPNGSLPSSPSHTLPLTPNTPLLQKSFILEDQGSGGKEPKKVQGGVKQRQPTNWDEFWAYCQKKGVKRDEAVYFFSTWEGNGWTTNNKPIKNWRAKVVSWHTAGYFESSKNNGTLHPR